MTEAVSQVREFFQPRKPHLHREAQDISHRVLFSFALRLGATKPESALKIAGSPGLGHHVNSQWES